MIQRLNEDDDLKIIIWEQAIQAIFVGLPLLISPVPHCRYIFILQFQDPDNSSENLYNSWRKKTPDLMKMTEPR